MLALNDMTVPTWRAFRRGGKLPKIHGEPKWHDFFERKWADEGLLETVGRVRRAKASPHGEPPS